MQQRMPVAEKPIRPRSPLALVVSWALGILASTLLSWLVGIVIETAGLYLIWPAQGLDHAKAQVDESLSYVRAAPQSVLVESPVAQAQSILKAVRRAYDRLGVIEWYRSAASTPLPNRSTEAGQFAALNKLSFRAAEFCIVSMFVAQETLLRLAIAVLATPAFALACLLGAVDGLAQRDLRRWGGGRESSTIYHNAKRLTNWSLFGGFTVYLAWPFSDFNPAYMVLICTALVATGLSITVSTFKKYA